MKKTAATITLAAVTGFTLLSASPAMAAPFQNCEQAALAGAYNIPIGSPAYNPDSDSDKDGIACENGNFGGYQAAPAAPPTATPAVPVVPVAPVTPVVPVAPVTSVVPMAPVTPVVPVAPVAPAAEVSQVAQMPVGGAATGIAQHLTDNTAALALGAGLVLAAAAGGTFVVRRRGAQA